MQRYVTRWAKQFLAVMAITFMTIFGVSVTCPNAVMAVNEYTISGQSSKKLYEGAAENSKVVANIVPGTRLTILDTVKDSQGKNWHHVLLAGGVTGYIQASWVVEVKDEAAEETAAAVEEQPEEPEQEEETQDQENENNTQEEHEEDAPAGDENNGDSEGGESAGLENVTVTALSNINLRDKPSLDGSVLIVIPRGATLKPLEKVKKSNYDWYKLTYLTKTGYIRADAVEEHQEEVQNEDDSETTDESTEETSEETSEVSNSNTSSSNVPKVVRNDSTTSVTYDDSYDRRHKWDDPEITTEDNQTSHKRFVDVFAIIFIESAIILIVIAIYLLRKAFPGLKRHFHIRSKKKKKRGERNGKNNRR